MWWSQEETVRRRGSSADGRRRRPGTARICDIGTWSPRPFIAEGMRSGAGMTATAGRTETWSQCRGFRKRTFGAGRSTCDAGEIEWVDSVYR
jgi:hypothetical protein